LAAGLRAAVVFFPAGLRAGVVFLAAGLRAALARRAAGFFALDMEPPSRWGHGHRFMRQHNVLLNFYASQFESQDRWLPPSRFGDPTGCQFVAAKARTGVCPEGDVKLMAKREVLEGQVMARSPKGQ
jgi:hypothetical protein